MSIMEGIKTRGMTEDNMKISIPLLDIISQNNIPKRTPEKPIEQGILGTIFLSKVSNIEFIRVKNIMRYRNCFEPNIVSTLDKARIA